MSESIKVVARFRPMNSREKKEGSHISVDVLDNHSCSVTPSADSRYGANQKLFNFDEVLTPSVSQAEVFQRCALPLVEDVMRGYNCTIFAYGQTGAGKTFSMEGELGTEHEGMIPRMISAVFDGICEAEDYYEFTVAVSYIEIYLEKLRDLLNPQPNQNLPIRENKQKGIYIDGATEVFVASVQEAIDLMHQGHEHRVVSCTSMNATSSRSHSVLMVKLTRTNTKTGTRTQSKMLMVDLAGSEKVRKTEAKGQTLEEAKKINQSLSALGNVINGLSEGRKHVSFRDSKLTRVLSDSLGGNSKTCLIICASPSSFNCEETITTLRFGVRAKKVKNKAKINQEKTVAEYKQIVKARDTLLFRQQDIIRALQNDIIILRGGGELVTPTNVPEEIFKVPNNCTIKRAPVSTPIKSKPPVEQPPPSKVKPQQSESKTPPEEDKPAAPEKPRPEAGDDAKQPPEATDDIEVTVAVHEETGEEAQEGKRGRSASIIVRSRAGSMVQSSVTELVQRLQSQLDEVKKQNDVFETQNTEYSDKIEALLDEMEEKKSEYDELKSKAQDDESKRLELEKLVEEGKRLKEEFEACQESFAAELDEAREQQVVTETRASSLESELEEKQTLLLDMQKEKLSMVEQMNDAMEKFTTLRLEKDDTEQRCVELESEVVLLREQQQEVASQESQQEQTQTPSTREHRQSDTHQSQQVALAMAAWKKERDSMHGETQSMLRSLNIKVNQCVNLQLRNSEIQSENNALHRRVDDLNHRLDHSTRIMEQSRNLTALHQAQYRAKLLQMKVMLKAAEERNVQLEKQHRRPQHTLVSIRGGKHTSVVPPSRKKQPRRVNLG